MQSPARPQPTTPPTYPFQFSRPDAAVKEQPAGTAIDAAVGRGAAYTHRPPACQTSLTLRADRQNPTLQAGFPLAASRAGVIRQQCTLRMTRM